MTARRPVPKPEASRVSRVLDAAGIGAFEWDVARDVVTVSPRMADITGLPEGEAPARRGKAFDPFIHPDDLAPMLERRARHYAAASTYETEYRIVRPDDGRAVWVRVNGVVTTSEAGKLACVSGIVQDVTERRLEDDQRQHLMSEMDHRVKNVLAAVQALAQQGAKRTTSLPAFLTTFGGRLKAMASANELLTAARWRGAAIDHLASAELGAIAPGQTSWEGPELFLTPRAANALSLALHELATNAVKFGALSVEGGQVKLSWTALPGGGFQAIWSESGGPTVSQPRREGFGSTLLAQVTGRELNGDTEVEYRPSGVRARLTAGAQ